MKTKTVLKALLALNQAEHIGDCEIAVMVNGVPLPIQSISLTCSDTDELSVIIATYTRGVVCEAIRMQE